jgi:hypothetical protein
MDLLVVGALDLLLLAIVSDLLHSIAARLGSVTARECTVRPIQIASERDAVECRRAAALSLA